MRPTLIGYITMKKTTVASMAVFAFVLIGCSTPEPKQEGFSISGSKAVHFAKGNVLHQPTSNKFQIAENQYDFIGDEFTPGNVFVTNEFGTSYTLNDGQTYAFRDTVTLISIKDKQGVVRTTTSRSRSNLKQITDSTKMLKDWISFEKAEDLTVDGYRMLTHAEWKYLIQKRYHADQLYAFATLQLEIPIKLMVDSTIVSIDSTIIVPTSDTTTTIYKDTTKITRFVRNDVEKRDIHGLVLLPDAWKGTELARGNSDWNDNVFTESNWASLEQEGAIFLPASGRSAVGTGGSRVQEIGRYWSSNHSSNGLGSCLGFGDNVVNPSNEVDAKYQISVRLVKE